MARVKAPLLSLGASGKLADAYVFSKQKNRTYVRQKVKPTNPQTAAQQGNRTHMQVAVTAWREYFSDPGFKPAWNLDAATQKGAKSGFNSFAGSVIAAQNIQADTPFADEVRPRAGGAVWFYLIDPLDGTLGTGGGPTGIYYGSNPKSLLFLYNRTPVQNKWMTTIPGNAGDRVYVQAIRDDVRRSGIYSLVLLA